MELSKLPLERLFGFIAGIIPGSAALFVYYLANPKAFQTFLVSPLGYSTKVAISLIISFVIGNSLSIFLRAIAGAVGGMTGFVHGINTPTGHNVSETAPWRDPKWRKLASRYLGDQAPNDTQPMPDFVFKTEQQALSYLPEGDPKKQALLSLVSSRKSLANDDSEWSQWYSQLDKQRIAQIRPDASEYIHGGLTSNLQVTAIYLIASMIFVPSVRRWFCICFCIGWGVLVIAETYLAIRSALDPWSTWSKQIDFLARETVGSAKKIESDSTIEQ